jgi:hypothetical protein
MTEKQPKKRSLSIVGWSLLILPFMLVGTLFPLPKTGNMVLDAMIGIFSIFVYPAVAAPIIFGIHFIFTDTIAAIKSSFPKKE